MHVYVLKLIQQSVILYIYTPMFNCRVYLRNKMDSEPYYA